MNKPVFKQTDPPSGNTSVGFDRTNQQFTKEGQSITAGSEWYKTAEKIDYNTLSDKQKEAINAFSGNRTDIQGRVYSSQGSLYFDQGSYWGDEQQVKEPLLVEQNFMSTEEASTNEPTIVPETTDEGINDFGARTFKVKGLKNNTHTFSENNPFTQEIKGDYIERGILTPARRWERLNKTKQERSENNRFGKKS